MPEGRVWATNPPDLGLAVQRQPKKVEISCVVAMAEPSQKAVKAYG